MPPKRTTEKRRDGGGNGSDANNAARFWLAKAEPDDRFEKGKNVAFSVDTFERVGVSSWDGVRNFQARNHLRAMRLGDQLLFYHSNTKVPGVAAVAKVCKEAYPDHTAWDPEHPYFDPTSDPQNPKWFMPDVEFQNRLVHFVPLGLLRELAEMAYLQGKNALEGEASTRRADVAYLDDAQLQALAGMELLNKSRLSVQTVTPQAFEAVRLLGERGGWSEWRAKWNVSPQSATPKKSGTDEPQATRPEAPARQTSRAAKTAEKGGGGASSGGTPRGRKRRRTEGDADGGKAQATTTTENEKKQTATRVRIEVEAAPPKPSPEASAKAREARASRRSSRARAG